VHLSKLTLQSNNTKERFKVNVMESIVKCCKGKDTENLPKLALIKP
jgi:hypothetical protein